MEKILIFYWYVPNFYWHPIYTLHLKNLMLYKDRFDKILFAISADEDSRGVMETIESISFFVPEADFIMVKNNKEARESEFFYNFVVKGLNDANDDVIFFFAHNKGVETIYVSPEDRNNWINCMYYFNLNNIGEVEKAFENEKTCAVGIGKMTDYCPGEFFEFCKHKWIFAGTFFWIFPKRIKNYMRSNYITPLPNQGRYYTEGFLGSIFPADGEECPCLRENKTEHENWGEYIRKIATNDELIDYKNTYGIPYNH